MWVNGSHSQFGIDQSLIHVFFWVTAKASQEIDPANIPAVCVFPGGAMHYEVL